jgi:putative DNA primase/helicase
MADLKKIKQNTDLVKVIERFVTLKKKGNEYEGCCPFHAEKTPSFKVVPKGQFFKCFGCGAQGDVWDFLYKQGMTTPEAVQYLGGSKEWTAEPPTRLEKPRRSWTQAVPTMPPTQDIVHFELGYPTKLYTYHTYDGRLHGYVCRFEIGNKKEFRQYIFMQSSDGKLEWRWSGFDKPRPLYNLHLIYANPDKDIMLVEGEKCADFITENTDYIATTWQNGVESLHHMNFAPLHGRRVFTWPDNDKPGYDAMAKVTEILGGVSGIVNNPPYADKGWDCADFKPFDGFSIRDSLAHYLAENIDLTEDMAPINEPPQHTDQNDDGQDIGSEYFRILGYEKTETGQMYHFFSYTSQTMISLSATSLAKTANLIQIAPLQYWESNYPGKSSMNINAAVNALVNMSYKVGFFSDKWIRGRGAWIDGKHVVIHAGDHIIVDGSPKHFADFKSRFIYERNEDLEFNLDSPLRNAEANQLLELSHLISWERDVNAFLLAGWCVIAPICGALSWRPHIWLTGAAGTGKSWIYTKLVRRCLGDISLAVQGETSEAGLRQTLRHDALPVVFDEAEGAERRDQERIQHILGLIRQSSSHDGGVIVKGTSGGGASKIYRIRSCFALASIAVQLVQQSDRSRVTILGLRKIEDKKVREQKWHELQRKYAAVMSDTYTQRLRARTIQMLPIILKNTEVFSNAAAAVLGEQRSGDQLGALLAGAYSLTSDKVVSFERAIEWIAARDWSEERGLNNTRDEIQLLRHILDQIIRIDGSGTIPMERTVGELVMIAASKCAPDETFTPKAANEKLRRFGLKVEPMGEGRANQWYLIVANQSESVAKWLFSKPQWANHSKILRRIAGSMSIDPTVFTGPIKSRAVAIPFSALEE